MQQVRLIRDWRRFPAGRVLERTAGSAEILVARSIAEYVKPARRKAVSAETAEGNPASKPATTKRRRPAKASTKGTAKRRTTKRTTKRSTKKAKR